VQSHLGKPDRRGSSLHSAGRLVGACIWRREPRWRCIAGSSFRTELIPAGACAAVFWMTVPLNVPIWKRGGTR